MSKEAIKAAEMAALKEQMKKELEDECKQHIDEWQVKGKNRRARCNSNMSNTKIEDNKFAMGKAKSNSESNSSGKEADDASSSGQPSEPKQNQTFSSFAESISNIMSRFSLQPAQTTTSEPEVLRDESTAEVTSPSSQTNDAQKNESSCQSPEPDNLIKEAPVPTLRRKQSYAAKKRAKRAAKNAAKQEQASNNEDAQGAKLEVVENKSATEETAGSQSEKKEPTTKAQGKP